MLLLTKVKQALPKKVLLILILSLVLVGVGLGFTLLLFTPQTPSEKAPTSLAQKLHFLLAPLRHFKTTPIQEEVIAALEKNLQFCEVVNQKDLSQGKKEFQLICNGRPFVAVWENEKISYELNGWSFLKEQPEVLKELQENQCRFYQTSQDNLLVFVCQDEKVRKYTYSTPDFQLTKQEEVPFTDAIVGQLLDATLLPCDFPTLDKTSQENFWAIKMKCRENSPATVYFDPEKLFFTLPVIVDEGLANEEKVRQSVELLQLQNCELKTQLEILEIAQRKVMAVLRCPETGGLIIDYDLELGMANFLFNKDAFVNLFPLLSQYHFAFLEDGEMAHVGSNQDDNYQYDYYLVNDRVLITQSFKEDKVIYQIYLKEEAIK